MFISKLASAYITSSSGDVTADAGSDITLEITASGIPDDITYVWKKNGMIIPRETFNTLSLIDVSIDDIGEYECIPSNSEGNHNSSIIQVDVKSESYCEISPRKCFPIFSITVRGFEVDSLEDTSVTLVPAAPSGYNCTPPIPQGELTTSGTIMISSGLDASFEGEYRCVSDDVNGVVIIDLDVVGMYKYTSFNLTYIFHCLIGSEFVNRIQINSQPLAIFQRNLSFVRQIFILWDRQSNRISYILHVKLAVKIVVAVGGEVTSFFL